LKNKKEKMVGEKETRKRKFAREKGFDGRLGNAANLLP